MGEGFIGYSEAGWRWWMYDSLTQITFVPLPFPFIQLYKPPLPPTLPLSPLISTTNTTKTSKQILQNKMFLPDLTPELKKNFKSFFLYPFFLVDGM